jgi:hypothetical protein
MTAGKRVEIFLQHPLNRSDHVVAKATGVRTAFRQRHVEGLQAEAVRIKQRKIFT